MWRYGPYPRPPYGPPATQGDGRSVLRPYGVGSCMSGFPRARE